MKFSKGHLYNGDCLEVLKSLPDDSVDSLVTDPPAGIAFMGKEWDKDKGGRDGWIKWMTEVMVETKRVMKPGAHGFVWGLPRTSHWTATALDNAGFEIRDIVTHIFGSGFPKNHDVSKALTKLESDQVDKYSGWGTALKPSNEHWILIRKPLEKKLTVAKNVLKHGTGGINIDASRIDLREGDKKGEGGRLQASTGSSSQFNAGKHNAVNDSSGRFPANTIVDESAVGDLDEQSLTGGMHGAGKVLLSKEENRPVSGSLGFKPKGLSRLGDSGGASRFFYCPKAPKKDKGTDNTHPTVKNTKLMSYLINMVTPIGGIVLDPFMGSGSTGVAAVSEGFEFIGIEQDTEYYQIVIGRIKDKLTKEKENARV